METVKSTEVDTSFTTEVRSRSESKSVKKWKNSQQDSQIIEILKKSGYSNKDDELSLKALKLKLKTLNPEVPDIKTRIQFGFLLKKHKNDLVFQKRWFFLISTRPVIDLEYERDESMIFKNPTGILLDTLYYYTFDVDTDDSKAKGDIALRYHIKII